MTTRLGFSQYFQGTRWYTSAVDSFPNINLPALRERCSEFFGVSPEGLFLLHEVIAAPGGFLQGNDDIYLNFVAIPSCIPI